MEHSQQFVRNNDVEKEMLERCESGVPLQKQATLEQQHSSAFLKRKMKIEKIFSYSGYYLSK
jgi:hypothetical protein